MDSSISLKSQTKRLDTKTQFFSFVTEIKRIFFLIKQFFYDEICHVTPSKLFGTHII